MYLITNLTSDIFIGQSHNKPVLRSVVLIFVLNNQAFSGIIISFSFSAPFKFDLIPLEVLLIFQNFNKPLKITIEKSFTGG